MFRYSACKTLSLTQHSKVGAKHLKHFPSYYNFKALQEHKGPFSSVAHPISLKEQVEISDVLLNFRKIHTALSLLDDSYTVTSWGKVAWGQLNQIGVSKTRPCLDCRERITPVRELAMCNHWALLLWADNCLSSSKLDSVIFFFFKSNNNLSCTANMNDFFFCIFSFKNKIPIGK